MEVMDLSSSSFITEPDDHIIPQHISYTEHQKLVLQNERQKEIINQLQASLDVSKNQLKEALETVAATSGIRDQLTNLQLQLADANEKREKMALQLKESASNEGDLVSRLTDQINELSREKNHLMEEMSLLSEQVSKARKDKSHLKELLEDKNQICEGMSEEISVLKSTKKKYRQKNAGLTVAVSELQSQLDKVINDNHKIANEKTTLLQDIDSLKVQLNHANQSISDSQNQVAQIQKDFNARSTSISCLEKQLESQNEEVQQMTKEKQKLMTLLQKMVSALSACEIKIETLKKENQILQARQNLKGNIRNSTLVTQYDILDLHIPFDGDLLDDCEKIMKLPQYQPVQRVQLILNEAAKRITECENESREIKKKDEELESKLNKWKTSNDELSSVLNALIKDLKNMASVDTYSTQNTAIRDDPKFIRYVAEKCSEIDPLLRDRVMSDSHFISNDFFFTDDITRKKREIQMIADQSEASFAIFASQFILNCLLRNQISNNSAFRDSFRKDDTASDDTQIVSTFTLTELQEKVCKLKKVNRALNAALKKAQSSISEANKTDNEQKTKIAQLQIQNESLKNDVDVLNMKLQVAQNDLAIKEKDNNSLSSFALHIKDNIEEQKRSAENHNSKLEDEIRRKTQENDELHALVKKMRADFDSTIKQQTKAYKRSEDAYKEEIAYLTEQVEAYESNRVQKKRTHKKKEKAVKQQYEAEIQALTENFEEQKNSLNATIESLKEKLKTSNEMSSKLVENISDLEQRTQQMKSENQHLVTQQKNNQVELATMKQQIAKERQQLQGQMAAQTIAYETKLQRTAKEAKNEAQKLVSDLLSCAAESLGSMYGLDENNFTDDSFKQLVDLVKSDLDKLRYFQEETTKFLK